MVAVLIDSSVLLDLVLYYQKKHRRNRSVASSAAAAIECLLFYEDLVVESASSFELVQHARATRYLNYYCDDTNSAVKQLHDLLKLCKPIEISANLRSKCYENSLDCLDKHLDSIPDPDDLRAYEMYDFLPYHLGEDPTSIECQINSTTASDLRELNEDASEYLRPILSRLNKILQDRLHPTRAAWALPLLRLLYYETLQQIEGTHFVPHATKSTIGFGRESQTIRSKRLIDYCDQSSRQRFSGRVQILSKGQSEGLLFPSIAATLLSRCIQWRQLTDTIYRLRESQQLQQMRSLFASTLDAPEAMSCGAESRSLAAAIHRSLDITVEPRRVVISLPFFAFEDIQSTLIDEMNAVTTNKSRVLIHQLFRAA